MMNIEICKNCKYYPEWFEFIRRNKAELVFHGYRKNEKLSMPECSCIVKHVGTNFNGDYGYVSAKFKPETLLSNPRIEPMKHLCPYYAEHIVFMANKGVSQ